MSSGRSLMCRIYFSHSVSDRATSRSAAALDTIRAALPTFAIVDPNSIEISVGHSRDHAGGGRDFFKDTIQGCDALAFLRLNDGRVGEHWAREIKWALAVEIPVFEVAKGGLVPVDRMPQKIRTRDDLWKESLDSEWI